MSSPFQPCLPWDYPAPAQFLNSTDTLPPICTSYDDGKEYRNNLEQFNDHMIDFKTSEMCEKMVK